MHNHRIHLEIFRNAGVEVFLKREDLIHPVVSGNKFRKLKYNLQEVNRQNYSGILTFGGAFSNHIAATAYACKEAGVPCVGIIRGEELQNKPLNKTLEQASRWGMQLEFVTREKYRLKMSREMTGVWEQNYPGYFILPEGGSNALAVKGCEEILGEDDINFDVVCAAVGTGGTVSGLIRASLAHQTVLGFPALKGDFLKDEIAKFVSASNWELITRFHFGGYARVSRELIEFINTFKRDTGVALDPVYTGKMMYGIKTLVEEGYFSPGTTILAIHTGGLQGIEGMNQQLKRKKLPLLQ